ncbi:MAG: polyprenyl diphosphate synthase [Chloroflexota bacterium]|nr:polyprenyl diphosphate synthase [Chloroflexota bacterium]
MADSNIAGVPNHVAIIMDGNGRWARQRKLPRLAGHRAGTDNIYPVIECLADRGVKYVTLYVFSTENWSRPRTEVQGLMRLLEEKIEREAQRLNEKGIKLVHIGRRNGVSEGLQQKVREAIELTKNNTNLTLCVAFNYGGRSEIIDAIKQMMEDGVSPDDVNDEQLSKYLYTANLPDPDLIIRTGGEMRISNFMLWQAAYSEYYVTPTLWPDFGPEEIGRALAAFNERERRFGGLRKKTKA